MSLCCSMHSLTAARGVLSAARPHRCMSSAAQSTPSAPAPATDSAPDRAADVDTTSPATATAAAPPRPPTIAGISKALTPKVDFNARRIAFTVGGGAPRKTQKVPYVPPSQGGTTLAAQNQLSTMGSGTHYRAGGLYTPADLDESQPKTFPLAVPSLSTIQFDAFKAMGTDPLASYKDVTLLSNFVTETGMLMHRKHTKLSAKNQRKLTKAVKRARAMGLMPHTYRMETQTQRNWGVGFAEYLNLAPRA